MNNNNYNITTVQESTGLCPGWISGFIDSDGSFSVNLARSTTTALGYTVSLSFTLTQHLNNLELFNLFPVYFGTGSVFCSRERLVYYKMGEMHTFETQLFPLLEAHPLMTQKRLDYADFKRVCAMVKRREHLTPNGLNQICLIKEGMNRGRY